jgi:hypothetical protein
MILRLKIIFILSIISFTLYGQSLLDQLKEENSKKPDTVFTDATFKSTRLINGQSVETLGKNELNLIFSHRFGNLNSGIHQLYGLDVSSIRIGAEYGLADGINIGLGRSRDQELVDSYIKLKLLRQSSGAVNMPISVSLYSSFAFTAAKWLHPEISYSLYDRFSYVNELLIARKFYEKISLQIMPGFIFINLTEKKKDKNLMPYFGAAGRYKITNRFSVSTEYYWVYPGISAQKIYDPLSFGVDIETGGHIFQLQFSNSRGMHERIMIPGNSNNWLKGDFGFGFNIIRNFNLKRN